MLHTIGHILHLVLSRNINGYEISSDNYFNDLLRFLSRELDGAARSSFCESRQKLSWKAFQFLLKESQIPSERLPIQYKWKGHIDRAIDGSTINLPHSKAIIEVFPQKKSGGDDLNKVCHYPQATLVTACNVFSGQPTTARVYNMRGSEKLGTLSLIRQFKSGDICLLDRDIGGNEVWAHFERKKQFFVNRLSIGSSTKKWVQEFCESGKKEKIITRIFKDQKTKKEKQISLRLIRGPLLKDGSTLVLATNLMNKECYPRQDIVQLYPKRWAVELMYAKVKTLLQLDKFHAKKVNGILQEIFANLLVISIATIVVIQSQIELEFPIQQGAPNFKNAGEVFKRYIYIFVAWGMSANIFRQHFLEMLGKIKRIVCKKQANKSYARYSRRPINHWAMAKRSKIKANELGRRPDAPAELRTKYRKLDAASKLRAA